MSLGSICLGVEPDNKKEPSFPNVVEEKTSMSVLDGNQTILRYRHTGVPMKPYVDQLFSPKGVQVLRIHRTITSTITG